MRSFLLICLFTGSFGYISAQNSTGDPISNPEKIIEQVRLFSQKTNSISADFLQDKEMSFMEERIISSGRFYFQKEKMLRWEYTEPFNYAIILNGERIRIIDEGKSKDFDGGSNRMFLQISEVMTGMVNGTLLTSDKFTASWYDEPGYYKAKLVPTEKSLQDYLDGIEISINKQDFSVGQLKMFEKSGDYTRISFSNIKLNENIPVEIFRMD